MIVVLGGATAAMHWHTREGRTPVAEAATSPDVPKSIAPPVPANPSSRLVAGLPPITIPPAAPVIPEPAPQPNSTGEQSKNVQDIPEDKLNAAGAALAAVSRVRNDYQQRIAKARPNDKKRLIDQGDNAMQKAITDKGLSIDEYKAILGMAQNDPDLQATLIERAKAAQKQ